MAGKLPSALEVFEADIREVGVEAAALRLTAGLAGVEADAYREFLVGQVEALAIDVAAVTRRLAAVLGLEVGKAATLLEAHGSGPLTGGGRDVLSHLYDIAIVLARAAAIIGLGEALAWVRSEHSWLGGAPLEVLSSPGGAQRVFGLLESLEDGNYL